MEQGHQGWQNTQLFPRQLCPRSSLVANSRAPLFPGRLSCPDDLCRTLLRTAPSQILWWTGWGLVTVAVLTFPARMWTISIVCNFILIAFIAFILIIHCTTAFKYAVNLVIIATLNIPCVAKTHFLLSSQCMKWQCKIVENYVKFGETSKVTNLTCSRIFPARQAGFLTVSYLGFNEIWHLL